MSNSRTVRQFEKRMAEVLRMRPAQLTDVFQGARPSSIRINRLLDDEAYESTLRAVREKAPKAVPLDWCDHTFLWPENDGFDDIMALAHEGRVYVQNASSLIPPVALDPRPGDSILDVAAAPGGKAFHLAARAAGDCRLWLNDAAAPRARKLGELAELYGVRYAELTTYPAQYVDKSIPAESFDRILLDVQCSGEGRVDLRRPVTLRYWSEERIEKYKFLQTKMLSAAYRLLRPGGVMVYSTCTLSPEENEFPVSKILQRHADLTLEPLDFSEPSFQPGVTSWRGMKFDARLADAVRVAPTDLFEGFFVARIVKAAAPSA
ncbi:RsmB/NOP family class I SAM-dependent RNA methyltransferase [Streptomyces odontomachi]|uniref:RsmB/NOP family class I SAM-dependent RNA methyltransferase n=1 Tax=Streptomyces odontomachi TaxID=2944940 RepID=UPI00210C7AF3|nr:RsmB/NOP family class I SAM-dependent RNA methyltransferase [Streptomyces sp. ODS25]